jgi:hypothetical protein
MKRLFLFLTLFAILPKFYGEETGETAEPPAEIAQESTWRNWVFAASALVTATIGIIIISLNTGDTSPDNQK